MTKTITKEVLKKKLAGVQLGTGYNRSATSGNNGSEEVSFIFEKQIVKIKNDTVITNDGITARLFSPLPCLHWKCLVSPNSAGECVLENALTGLFVVDSDNTYYCIGVNGNSSEFELRIQFGSSEVRMNKDFLNVVTKHLVKNGLEE